MVAAHEKRQAIGGVIMSVGEITGQGAADRLESAFTAAEGENFGEYRVVSRSAIISLVVFACGLTGLFLSVMLILPVAGLLVAYSAWRTIRRYPAEFTGEKLALAGMVLNGLLFVGGTSMHAYEYATEVPPGFERVAFSDLQPESMRQANTIPARAKELHGSSIFIKGYVHPGVDGMGKVKEFVLVPDMGTCCFGGQPKLTDMILVKTGEENRVSYRRRMVKLAGEFGIGNELENAYGVNGVLYRLEACYSK
jgi:hypothetical protein